MKKIVCCVMLIGMFALSAFAASGTAKLKLMSPGLIAGKQLTAGDYKMTWTGEGNDVQVTIVSGKNTVLTAPAKLIEMANTPANDAVVKTADGSITQVRFGGKKAALSFIQ